MVATEYETHERQLQERRQQSRAFILRTLTPIAAELGDGYEVELPKDIMNEGTGYIVTPDSKRLIFHYESLEMREFKLQLKISESIGEIPLNKAQAVN